MIADHYHKEMIPGASVSLVPSSVGRSMSETLALDLQNIDYQSVSDIIDFNFYVKPFLSDRCFASQGPDMANQKGNLRLNTITKYHLKIFIKKN